ncbi:hypothetical protein AB0I34_22050 [Kribbella sp. NPDC050281]|uniref:hypothetical protein n=1 Tax=Kribbella sp. NPDC050281 TaxID=3155515 RepID=UPI0033C15AF5
MSSGDFLEGLESEVSADLAMARAGAPAADTPPSEWLVDPEEVEVEQTEYTSLLGAVQALETDRMDPGETPTGRGDTARGQWEE